VSDERCLNIQRNTLIKTKSSDKLASTQTITKVVLPSRSNGIVNELYTINKIAE
jgi:hypothetical protein